MIGEKEKKIDRNQKKSSDGNQIGQIHLYPPLLRGEKFEIITNEIGSNADFRLTKYEVE
jgi:hypothetical protein